MHCLHLYRNTICHGKSSLVLTFGTPQFSFCVKEYFLRLLKKNEGNCFFCRFNVLMQIEGIYTVNIVEHFEDDFHSFLKHFIDYL